MLPSSGNKPDPHSQQRDDDSSPWMNLLNSHLQSSGHVGQASQGRTAQYTALLNHSTMPGIAKRPRQVQPLPATRTVMFPAGNRQVTQHMRPLEVHRDTRQQGVASPHWNNHIQHQPLHGPQGASNQSMVWAPTNMYSPWNPTHTSMQALTSPAASHSVHTYGSNIGHQAPLLSDPNLIPIANRHLHLPGALKPTTMALYGPGVEVRTNNAQDNALRRMSNMSPNYRGDPNNIRHHSQDFLRDEQNCAFWLTGLPHDVTYKEVLDAIRECGPIYNVHISNEKAAEEGSAAAKVVFFNEQGAGNCYRRHVLPLEEGGEGHLIYIQGRWIKIIRNRIKIPQQSLPRHFSRCVRITGPQNLITYQNLTFYFSTFCHYDLEDAIRHLHPGEHNVEDIEFRFAKFEAQVQAVFKAMNQDEIWKGLDPSVTIRFVADPCDVSPQPNPIPNAALYENGDEELGFLNSSGSSNAQLPTDYEDL